MKEKCLNKESGQETTGFFPVVSMCWHTPLIHIVTLTKSLVISQVTETRALTKSLRSPSQHKRNLYVSRLFLVSLVPWINKPWGNTLRENLRDPCTCGIQIGALRNVNKLFWRRCQGTIDLRSNLTCIRKYFFFLIFLFDFFCRSLIFCAN